MRFILKAGCSSRTVKLPHGRYTVLCSICSSLSETFNLETIFFTSCDLLSGVTVTLSFSIGPAASGILAVFPIILISVILILHQRVGGRPTAAVMANAVVGLVGFAGACLVLHYTADSLGAAVGLSLALATSVAWNVSVFFARRYGITL